MSDIKQSCRLLLARVLEGPGEASRVMRHHAFDNTAQMDQWSALVDKVARYASEVTDEDIEAARNGGLNEDQIFEIVVCAAIGQATRQYNGALAVLKDTSVGK